MSGRAALPQMRPHSGGADPLQAHFIWRALARVVLNGNAAGIAPSIKVCSSNKERVALGINNLSGAALFLSDEQPVPTNRFKTIANGSELVLDLPNGPQNALYVAGGTAGFFLEVWEIVRVYGDDYFRGQE